MQEEVAKEKCQELQQKRTKHPEGKRKTTFLSRLETAAFTFLTLSSRSIAGSRWELCAAAMSIIGPVTPWAYRAVAWSSWSNCLRWFRRAGSSRGARSRCAWRPVRVLNNCGVVGQAAFQTGHWLRCLADLYFLNVGPLEDDVLVRLLARGDRSVGWPVLRAIRPHWNGKKGSKQSVKKSILAINTSKKRKDFISNISKGRGLRRQSYSLYHDVLSFEDFEFTKQRSGLTFGQSHCGFFGVDRVEDALVADFGLGNQRDLRSQIRDTWTGRHCEFLAGDAWDFYRFFGTRDI